MLSQHKIVNLQNQVSVKEISFCQLNFDEYHIQIILNCYMQDSG